MTGFERRGHTTARTVDRRTPSRIADFGDRLTRAFSPRVLTPDDTIAGEEIQLGDEPDPLAGSTRPGFDEVLPRFPVVRHGYDCAKVDEYVGELERELAELDLELAEVRANPPARNETAAEIERIGKETSTILLAAHESAQDTIRQAQAQADSCLSEARSTAVVITNEANRRVGELRDEIAALRRDRSRILEDVRRSAGALSALADDVVESPPTELAAPVPVPAGQLETCYHAGMAEGHRVAMLMLHEGTPQDLEARDRLAATLPGAEVTEPDDVGAFEVVLDAEDQEQALQRAWDAVAASGADDQIVFLEHPELPEHWRHRSRRLDR